MYKANILFFIILINTHEIYGNSLLSSAIRLRNGDQYYISNETQQLVINYNLYIFQDFNLFYFCQQSKTTTFLSKIPTQKPKAICLVPSSVDGIEEGNTVLVMTSTCLMSFDIQADAYGNNIDVEAGHCYESGNRDGPHEFSRFNDLGTVAASRNNIWVVSDNVLGGSRLCLIHNNNVVTWGGVWSSIRALSISFVDKIDQVGELFVAVCWSRGGLSILWIPKYETNMPDDYKILESLQMTRPILFSQIVVNSITLMRKEREGKRVLYLFTMDKGSVLTKQQIEWRENATIFSSIEYQSLPYIGEAIGMYVDFPYGVFVADGKTFHKVNILGCVCPPGYGLVDNNGHCQTAPLGGYVDILSNFIPCPAGTFADSVSSTSSKVCLPCPPYQISKYPQSIKCTTCFSGGKLLPHNAQRTQCATECPIGSYLDGGSCVTCGSGSSLSAYSGVCELCQPNTYSNPAIGIIDCTLCPLGKVSASGSSACSVLCSESRTRKDILLTISVLGIKPVAAALCNNGTVYLVGFQTLIVIEKSGGSTSLQLEEFTLVRDIILGQDERVLFAAVSTHEILRLSFIQTSYMSWSRIALLPEGSSIVGLTWGSSDEILLHDAQTNSIYNHSKDGVSMVYGGKGLIVCILFAGETIYALEQAAGLQIITKIINGKTSTLITLVVDEKINPYMTFWKERLILSYGHSIAWLDNNRGMEILVGMANISGRVDSTGHLARLSNPGPMLVTETNDMLIFDENGLRIMYAFGDTCQCEKDFYLLDGKACVACPLGMFSMPGTKDRCTNCKRGQYYDASGACIACPKMSWWKDDNYGCPSIVDTLVGRDSTGLSLEEILMEMSYENPQYHEFMDIMKEYDYLSVHTLQLPLRTDSIELDALANGRFWQRTKRNAWMALELPGFWLVCGVYVLQTQSCSCRLPSGGITLLYQWNKVKKKASSIDYSTLNIQAGINISISPSAIFVSRTDAIYDNLVYVDSLFKQLVISIPGSQKSEGSFGACVAGWPATYTCSGGFLWIAPLQKCVPCKAGFYQMGGHCIACPIGSFSEYEGSTMCIPCASASHIGSHECRLIDNSSSCIAGFFKSDRGCKPCAPGSYNIMLNATSCVKCHNNTVSSQWGSSSCVSCAVGYTSLPDRCIECNSVSHYFTYDSNHTPLCIHKTILKCGRGYYLEDGHGGMSDNRCVQCQACSNEEIMVPYNTHPCNYDYVSVVGAPYKCVPVKSIPGLFARLSIHLSDVYNFSIRYTPCDGIPPFASWTQGSNPTFCYFKCDYAISETAAIQYAYYLTARTRVLAPKENTFVMEYPSQSIQLNALSQEICLPCPKTQCDWGKFRRITDAVHGCGLPTCTATQPCQVVPGGIISVYKEDGCISNCTIPENSYITDLSLPGTDDNCGWKCKLGYYQDIFHKCSLCSPTVCETGQVFIANLCLPDRKKEDFCLACPIDTKGFAILSIESSRRGICEYNCVNGTYLSDTKSKPPVCMECTSNVFCPIGFRRVCSVETCEACPALPISLWGSAVKMPSNQDTCQAACRSGYHTIDIGSGQVINSAVSYNVNSIRCILCSLRPTVPCTSSTNLCTSGYYMPVPGSGICKQCPTVYTCGAGFTPSSCICTVCKMKMSNAMFVTQQAADAVGNVMDSGTCPVVCMHNTVFVSGECIPCDTLLQGDRVYYAVWNASKGTRWWDESEDPQHLPLRPSGEEKRAGVCWPCPEGFTTLMGDQDLCTSTLIPQQKFVEEKVNVINITNTILTASQHGFFTMFSYLFSKNKGHARRLLSTGYSNNHKGIKVSTRIHSKPHSELLYTCPLFAFLDEKNTCVCRQGFTMKATQCVNTQRNKPQEKTCSQEKYKDEHGNCRLCPFQQIYNTTTRKCNSLWGVCMESWYRDVSSGMCKKCPGNTKPLYAFNFAKYEECLCARGYSFVNDECKPCPRGTYSSFIGRGPCTLCPNAMTTLREGAEDARECVMEGLTHDVLFVDHRAEEFYIIKKRAK